MAHRHAAAPRLDGMRFLVHTSGNSIGIWPTPSRPWRVRRDDHRRGHRAVLACAASPGTAWHSPRCRDPPALTGMGSGSFRGKPGLRSGSSPTSTALSPSGEMSRSTVSHAALAHRAFTHDPIAHAPIIPPGHAADRRSGGARLRPCRRKPTPGHALSATASAPRTRPLRRVEVALMWPPENSSPVEVQRPRRPRPAHHVASHGPCPAGRAWMGRSSDAPRLGRPARRPVVVGVAADRCLRRLATPARPPAPGLVGSVA